jgi:acetolactate synthase-1/2/3 large subunit
MNVQEFETISFNNLPIKVFIINNGGYGLIKGTLETFLDRNYVGVDGSSGLGIPDFEKIAYAYDIQYQKLSNHKNLKEKIDVLLDENKPVICDIMVDPDQRVIPKLESGNALHDMAPNLEKTAIDLIMQIEN